MGIEEVTGSDGANERKRRRKNKSAARLALAADEAGIEAKDYAAIEFSTEVAATMLPTTTAKAGVKRNRSDVDG